MSSSGVIKARLSRILKYNKKLRSWDCNNPLNPVKEKISKLGKRWLWWGRSEIKPGWQVNRSHQSQNQGVTCKITQRPTGKIELKSALRSGIALHRGSSLLVSARANSPLPKPALSPHSQTSTRGHVLRALTMTINPKRRIKSCGWANHSSKLLGNFCLYHEYFLIKIINKHFILFSSSSTFKPLPKAK